MVKYWLYSLICLIFTIVHGSSDSAGVVSPTESIGSFKIEGKIIVPPGDNSLENTRIMVDEGLYVGIPQVDGTFAICGSFYLKHKNIF